MVDTVVCYLEHDNKILMLHRTKKKVDINKNKFIGIGGKIEKDEKPIDAVIREFKEETGLDIINPSEKGFAKFQDGNLVLGMHIFTAKEFTGDLIICNEGDLSWVKKDKVMNLNLWEGDRLFLNLIFNENISSYFKIEFVYDNQKLIEYRRIQ